MIDTLTENFIKLFSGRTDAYGTWEGGNIKTEVTSSQFSKHLWGQEYIGIYPLMDNSTVNWGCSDIDVNEIDQAKNIQLALKMKNITSWIERTVKGYHVWVFATEPTEAWIMRRALLVAHLVAKVPAKEINPKQETASGYGNYVRLPYPGYNIEPVKVRYILDNNNNQMSLEDFVADALNNRTPIELLTPLAKMYVQKQQDTQYTKTLNTTSAIATPLEIALASINPYAAKILINGPLEGSDRSSILCTLAFSLKESNMPIEEAFGIVITADQRWGKFYNRKDGMERLAKLMEWVYAS